MERVQDQHDDELDQRMPFFYEPLREPGGKPFRPLREAAFAGRR